jgi:ribosomal protein S18 acetylase RimI-like enzyme
MNTSFQVRRIEASDAEVLRQIRIASLTEAPYAFGARLEDVLAQAPDSFKEAALRHSISDTSTSFLLLDESSVVGIIGAFVEPTDAQRAFICAFWVAPQHRGTGGSRMLVDSAVEWLEKRRASGIFAWVSDTNSRAQAFYRKVGFVATREVQALPSAPSQSETLWIRNKNAD